MLSGGPGRRLHHRPELCRVDGTGRPAAAARRYAAKLGWNDRLLPLFMEVGKYEGKLCALAHTYDAGLFYNKTLSTNS